MELGSGPRLPCHLPAPYHLSPQLQLALPSMDECCTFIADTPSLPPKKARGRALHGRAQQPPLGGSWDLVSKVISTLIGLIVTYNYSYLICSPNFSKSHDPLSRSHVPSDESWDDTV